MLTTREIERAAKLLPLNQRQTLLSAIEQSIDDEYEQMAAEGIASDIQIVERYLARIQEAKNLPWDQLQREVLLELRRGE